MNHTTRRVSLFIAVLPCLLAVLVHRDVFGLAYTGIDAPAWVADTCGNTMDGWRWCLFEKHFVGYRPLTALSYAIGSLVHGTSPLGYHSFDLLLFAGLVAATQWVSRGLGASAIASSLGAALVAVHPLALEVVPVLARRGDLIATLASLVAFGAFWRGHYLAAAALTFAALAAKETSFAVLPVLGLVALMAPGSMDRPGRSRALKGLSWSLAVVPIVFLLRYGALGEWFGGYPKIEDVSTFRIVLEGYLGLVVPYSGSFDGAAGVGEELSTQGLIASMVGGGSARHRADRSSASLTQEGTSRDRPDRAELVGDPGISLRRDSKVGAALAFPVAPDARSFSGPFHGPFRFCGEARDAGGREPMAIDWRHRRRPDPCDRVGLAGADRSGGRRMERGLAAPGVFAWSV